MKCRIDIKGRKIWNDNNNAHGKRPASVQITLLRDGEYFDTATATAGGGWTYGFPCLIAWDKAAGRRHEYRIDESDVTEGYIKTVQGFNILNTLDTMVLNGSKIWDDNDNAGQKRPGTITVNLLQNGEQFDSLELTTPGNQNTVPFSFEDVPFADDAGKPYAYTVDEAAVGGYTKAVNGFNITNTLIKVPFSFNKTSVASGLSLQGAVFEIRQNGALIATSASDAAGRVYFSGLIPGDYQMAETVPPVGYMSNTHIYDVAVSADGSVTVDGMHADEFSVQNTPEAVMLLERATAVSPAYTAAPNTWPLHGAVLPDLYMLDKILITLRKTPVTVKWAYGVQDEAYFRAGGGIDITATYQDGIPAPLNTDYTVYALFTDGTDAAETITVDRLRDGTTERPYLLIDFTTADALEPSLPGIDQFTLYYMQGNGIKLTQHYEIYENIDMEGKTWEPIGPLGTLQLFTGSLYGNGNEITDLTVGDMAAAVGDYLGFFRFIGDGASIQNMSITNGSIGDAYVSGGFTGYVWIEKGGSVLLKDLHFSGAIKSQGYGGGIAGVAAINDGSLIIDGCTVNGSIEGNYYYAGGIAGGCETSATGSLSLSDCYTSGSVSCKANTSGAIGILTSDGSADISGCVNAMKVEGPEYAGGIAAILTGTGSAVISSCYNKGDITGSTCGGIAGGNYHNPALNYKIINCYNSGSVNASSAGGGIYGFNYGPSVTQNCYNTGNVTASNAGGISLNYGTTENCAALCQTVSGHYQAARISPVEISAQTVLNNNVAFDNMQVLINGVQKFPLDTGSAGADGISVTPAMLKAQTLYENALGWDFANVWSFGNGAYTLPVLRGIPVNLQPDVLPPHLA